MRTIIVGLLALAAANISQVDASEESAMPAETKRVGWASLPVVKQNVYRAQRMKDNPTIDANWNKAAWKGVAPLTIEYYMGDAPKHQPKAQAKVAYDDHHIYVIWKVEDKFVLAKRTGHQQEIWKDSCVEFFFSPGGAGQENDYFNLETNCAGFKLLHANVAGSTFNKFTDNDFSSIVTASSLKGPINPEIAGATTWTLEYKIPLSLLEKHAKVERPKPGVTWRANFYKCADDSSHPHWLTWSPVTNPVPQFHLPKYFGILAFD